VLARHLEKNQVVHVHVHFAFGAASLAIFLEALAGIPYSLSIHGTDALRPTPLAEAKIGRARFVATNCRYHVKVLRSRYIGLYDQRFFLIRGGLDLTSGPWSEHRPAEVGLPLRLLHVGRLSPEKAQPVLLRALARLKEEGVEFVCRIAGDGPERPRLEGLIQELRLAGRVELLGALPQERVTPLYDWCQALLMSSLSEGTPMTIVEAMAKARAVVATDITGVPEMVQDGITALLVKPNSAPDLAAKLGRLAAEPDLARRLGQAGRARAEELFDLTANSRRFLAVLAQEVPALGLPRGEEVEDE
jgi:glycosyltransferase involved in cell wall biosynthesis